MSKEHRPKAHQGGQGSVAERGEDLVPPRQGSDRFVWSKGTQQETVNPPQAREKAWDSQRYEGNGHNQW